MVSYAHQLGVVVVYANVPASQPGRSGVSWLTSWQRCPRAAGNVVMCFYQSESWQQVDLSGSVSHQSI